jgi:hypothetical protein
MKSENTHHGWYDRVHMAGRGYVKLEYIIL